MTVQEDESEPEGSRFRPPAVPLIACDPYFSVWSMADRLTDDATRHWTGAAQAMTGMVRIGGRAFRLMGNEPAVVPAMDQVSIDVLPTRTVYAFEAAGVRIGLTFMTTALADDLEVLSRPVTYVTCEASSTDGGSHPVALYFDASAALVVNSPDQAVVACRYQLDGRPVLRVGSAEQRILGRSGDDLRIEWGYLYAATIETGGTSHAIGAGRESRERFAAEGVLPESDDLGMPRLVRDGWTVLAVRLDLGEVGDGAVSRTLLLAYDDLFSIEYFHRRLQPYWRRNGAGPDDLLRTSLRDHESLTVRCRAFDDALTAELARSGGPKYARLGALAYRQCVAAHKLAADLDGTPLLFSKENFSNGCIATVDVTYPSSPFFLAFNPALLKAQLRPVLEYASLPRWRFPFSPHDLGTYPLANGQVYGGGERSEDHQMPVEENGNMLLMAAALAAAEGGVEFALGYWPVLHGWAEYLCERGLDPENQLCTDDFAGHLAHNVNLSLKAILAIGAFARLCARAGKPDDAVRYRRTAEGFVERWLAMADDGDHYRLAFDRPGSWSQKYNLVWDRLLGLNLFPDEVARKEIAFHRTRVNAFGLPLDSRKTYTKLDWVLWSATMTGDRDDFDALIEGAYRYADETPSRVPLSDWYETLDGKMIGMQARSVVGGIFLKLLADRGIGSDG